MVSPEQTESVANDLRTETVPRQLPSGALVATRYEIRELLGSGGFGLVYRAFDSTLRREVALKILRADRESPASLERFRREAAVARDAESPNLLRIFDFGMDEGGYPFLVMELIAGGSLRDRLTHGPLSSEEVRALGIDLLRGLAALHARGVVHRDVKPGNLLVASEGRYKLGDLGLARSIVSDETQLTIGNAPVGTLDYLAPEQVLGRDAETRSDLYSAGLVLLEALTGKPAFPTHGSLASLLQRVQQPAPVSRRLVPGLPRWLARFLRRLLERDPDRRYGSAAEALADLEAKRAAISPSSRARGLALALLGLCALVWATLAWQARQYAREFDHLEPLGAGNDDGVRAIDRSGRAMWSIPGIQSTTSRLSALARIRPGEPARLVAGLRRSQDFDQWKRYRLSVLATETGEVLETIDLNPGEDRPFRGFADRFLARRVAAVDLDGDGLDEILVSFHHGPSWPSYTLLWEPSVRRTRVVLLATGHHAFTRAADLDRDGRPELLFNGINSTLGSYHAVAAVRLEPWIGEKRETFAVGSRAVTPGCTGRPPGEQLAGYRLLPPGDLPLSELGIQVDEKARTVRLHYQDRAPFQLAFDDWLARPEDKRGRAERSAWAEIAEAMRLAEMGSWANAVLAAERGVDAAKAAGDDLLTEAAGRLRAKALIGGGRLDDGEAALARLAERSQFSSEIAFDAALALHLSGKLDRAVSWYERGLELGDADRGAMNRYFYLEGIVFAFVEQQRWREAEGAVDRFVVAFPQLDSWAELLREWVFTRSGRKPFPAPQARRVFATDAQHYLDLERSWGAGTDAEKTLLRIEQELAQTSYCRGALLSLKGAILTSSGRPSEARVALEEAISLLVSGAHRRTLDRAVLPQARERAAAVGVPSPVDHGTDLARTRP